MWEESEVTKTPIQTPEAKRKSLDIRTLIKDDNTMLRINDGDIVKYTGIYYQSDTNNITPKKTELPFIGKIYCEKSRYDTGITGIYINPLYVFYEEKKWHRIINYKLPTKKYFYYPHLLMLPESYNHFYPLHFLHTLENISLDEFEKNTPHMGEIELNYIL
jgi:hypothetical protein